VAPRDSAGRSAYGIALLAEVSRDACEFVRSVCAQERTRILAIVANAKEKQRDYAWQLLHAGASDVLEWNDLQQPGDTIAARLTRWQEIDSIVTSPLVRNNLVGKSRAWTRVLRRLVEAARYTGAPILLVGETGTGKELASRLVHSLDRQRSKHELIVLDCTTIVPDLSGSELFGHERGAFTGAVSARDGAFALADSGTLFLDEVGELPATLQVQLLRVLQEGTYKRVGSNTWRRSDFRLLCATNRDLHDEQAQGSFRRDLYHRIASWTIRLPPLRERIEDIIPLVHHFLRQEASDNHQPLQLDDAVRSFFLTRNYPGNVRDLQGLVTRIATRHVGPGPITIGDIPSDERPDVLLPAGWDDEPLENSIRQAISAGHGLHDIREAVEAIAVMAALDNEDGDMKRAAQRLDVSLRTLQSRRAKYRDREKAVSGNGHL
jgi:transcriptional regulator with GAF, ATPase, and Fis domain